jgi:hypothetical protein
VQVYKTDLSEKFEYDVPIAVTVHPNGMIVGVVFLDRLRLYYVCSDGVRMGESNILLHVGVGIFYILKENLSQ